MKRLRPLAAVPLSLLSLAAVPATAQDRPPPTKYEGVPEPVDTAGAIVASALTRDPTSDPHDLEGTYQGAGGFSQLLGKDSDYLPAAIAVRKHRMAMQDASSVVASPHVTCRPDGMVFAIAPIFPVRIVQNDKKILMYMEEVRSIREISMTSSHPDDLKPSYQGNSVAHWEGDTLVVDTVGFNDRTWLDHGGTPHSDKLHVVQRITKNADGGLDMHFTLSDPETFARPMTIESKWKWITGTRQTVNDCEENPSPNQVEGMVYEDKYLEPVCTTVMQEEGSRVVCDRPRTLPDGKSR